MREVIARWLYEKYMKWLRALKEMREYNGLISDDAWSVVHPIAQKAWRDEADAIISALKAAGYIIMQEKELDKLMIKWGMDHVYQDIDDFHVSRKGVDITPSDYLKAVL